MQQIACCFCFRKFVSKCNSGTDKTLSNGTTTRRELSSTDLTYATVKMYSLSEFCCFCLRNQAKLKPLNRTTCNDTTFLDVATAVIPEIVRTRNVWFVRFIRSFSATARDRSRRVDMRGVREARDGDVRVS